MVKAIEKEVAFKPDTVATENLPFPTVLYPGHYGAFFAFKEQEGAEAYFCSCAYEAIENYIRIRKLSVIPQNIDAHRMYILSSFHFPLSVVENLMDNAVSEDVVLNHLKFKKKLCHECNRQIPSLRYCHGMYGGVFKQNYGWYVNKQAFEWAIDPLSLQFLPDRCPDEILDEMKIKPPMEENGWMGVMRGNDKISEETIKQLQKQNRIIRNIIENEVRRKFGHKKIGEAWTSETILYYIVKKLFPQFTIHRHYRPDFMNGLELDIFIEEPRIGIEYQGIQHYKAIKHWGGEEALEKLRIRDKKKKEFSKAGNITLICFEYNESLSDEFVSQKINPHL